MWQFSYINNFYNITYLLYAVPLYFYVFLCVIIIIIVFERGEKNLIDYGCQNVTILFTKKKHTIDFRERTRVESFEFGHESRSSSQPIR